MRFKFLEWDAARLEIYAKALNSGGEECQSFRLKLTASRRICFWTRKLNTS